MNISEFYFAIGIPGRCLIGLALGYVIIAIGWFVPQSKSRLYVVGLPVMEVFATILLAVNSIILAQYLALTMIRNFDPNLDKSLERGVTVVGAILSYWLAVISTQLIENAVRLSQGKRPLPIKWFRPYGKKR